MLTGDVPFHGENQVAVAMKHVREELPDVQLRRPRGLERARGRASTARPRRTSTSRYQDDAELIADLEDVLGDRDRALGPGHRRGDRGPPHAARPARAAACRWRVRTPARSLALLALVAAIAAVVARRHGRRGHATERGTGTRNVKPPPGLESVSLGQSRAKDFDPFGGDGGAPDRGQGGRRPGPELDLVDRELRRRRPRQEARRRHLRRRQARRRGARAST